MILKAWLFSMMMVYVPPERALQLPGWEETRAERVTRYHSIAEDIEWVVANRHPLAGHSRAQTAAIILALAIGESALSKDVDIGPCYRKKTTKHNYKRRCDGGLAVGITQVQFPPSMQARFWGNRRLLLARTLKGIKGSFGVCKANPYLHRLAAYGSGSCRRGHAGSAKRLRLAQKLRARMPRGITVKLPPPPVPLRTHMSHAWNRVVLAFRRHWATQHPGPTATRKRAR